MNCLIDPQKLLKKVCSFNIQNELGTYITKACLQMIDGKCEEDFVVKDKEKRLKSSAYTEEFEAFWAAYPKGRKVGKGGAFALFNKLMKKEPDLLQEVLSALEWQVKQENWTKEQGKYIPMPETYLSKRRWEDEKPEALPKKVRKLTPDGIWIDC